MSKKIKLLVISIFVIIGIMLFADTTYAWSPSNQTPIYPQGNYFCKEKGGAVRFTQISPSYYYETEHYTGPDNHGVKASIVRNNKGTFSRCIKITCRICKANTI